MNDFEIIQNMSLGQYEPGDSPVHRLVPAVKLSAVILLASAVFFAPLFPQLPLLFGFFCLTARLSGLQVRYLMRGVRPVLPFLLLIGVIQIFFISRDVSSEPLFRFLRFAVYPEDLLFTARLFARFFCLVLLFSLFSSVTPVTEISHGTESMLRPLSRNNGLSHDMALVVTITFRFIPILAQEAEHLTKAQASRGAWFGTWKMGLIKKLKLYIPLVIPLFIAALERSEILVEAMEARCYEPGAPRTRLDEYHWERRDLAALLTVIALFVLLLASRFIEAAWLPVHI